MVSAQQLLDYISNPDLLPQRERHYGLFYGIVVDNQDPLKLGRVRVRTPHYTQDPVESIPWASYSAASGGADNVGFYFVPTVGSQVSVGFVGGDPQYPIYLGSVPAAPGRVSEVHATHLNPQDPYDQGVSIDVWDITRFNSITTPSGHRIVLDDNKNYRDDGFSEPTFQSTRRILLESATGNYLRLIESKTSEQDHENALVELGSVDSRRIALDDDDETITITTPDEHSLEINSRNNYIRAMSAIGYQLMIDDDGKLIDLSTIQENSTTQDRGHRLMMSESDDFILLKTSNEKFMLHSKDSANGAGHMGIFGPYVSPSQSILPGVGIAVLQREYPTSSTSSVQLWSNDSSSLKNNGLLASPGLTGQRSQLIKLYDNPTADANVIELITDGKGLATSGRIRIGRTTGYNTITLDPVAGTIEARANSGDITLVAGNQIVGQSGSINLSATATATVAGQNIVLQASTIMMTGGSIVHDYFQHYHFVNLLDLANVGVFISQAPGTPVTQANTVGARTTTPQG